MAYSIIIHPNSRSSWRGIHHTSHQFAFSYSLLSSSLLVHIISPFSPKTAVPNLLLPSHHPAITPQAFVLTAPSLAPALNLLLLTNLNPASNITNPSTPRTTASVTIAPMTPATGLLTPPPPPPPLVLPALPLFPPEEGDVSVEGAHTPVVLPHALHQSDCEPTANLFIPAVKSFQLSVKLCCPKSG